MVRSAGLAVVVALLLVSVAIGLGPMVSQQGSPVGDDATARQANAIASAQQLDTDSTEYTLSVYPNGSVRWTLSYRRTLANATEQRGFESYAERFNNRETRSYREFVGLGERLTRSGTTTTGRRMEARQFRREARVTNIGNRGVVEMSFLWTNFGVTHENGTVVVGDVFDGGRFPDGLYLGPNERFVIERVGNGTVRSVTPTPNASTQDSVSWSVERDFGSGRPRVVFGTDTASETGLPIGLIGAGLLALAVVLALGWWGSRRRDPGSDPPASAGTPPAPRRSNGGDRGELAPAQDPEPAVSDEELLADDDRVRKLLAENGGRMRQVSIVENTDWSKSKVSMLLSEMETEGQISKLRIGRENIISLAGQEPTGSETSDRQD